ncbi:MAG: DUF2199 domain-containing protein [Proteobacteria bacterium]|nr:DUF2199 domain-containing protein [Pseudomonadota bacterium]
MKGGEQAIDPRWAEFLAKDWLCKGCGTVHCGIMGLGVDKPAVWPGPSSEAKSNAALPGAQHILTQDFCVLDGEHFFVRCGLELPLRGTVDSATFGYGPGRRSRARISSAMSRRSTMVARAARALGLAGSQTNYRATRRARSILSAKFIREMAGCAPGSSSNPRIIRSRSRRAMELRSTACWKFMPCTGTQFRSKSGSACCGRCRARYASGETAQGSPACGCGRR